MKSEKEQAVRLDQIKGLAAISDLENPDEYELKTLYWLVSIRNDHPEYEAIKELCFKHGTTWTIADYDYCAYHIALGTATDDEREACADHPKLEGRIAYWRKYISNMGKFEKRKGAMSNRNKVKRDRVEKQYEFTT